MLWSPSCTSPSSVVRHRSLNLTYSHSLRHVEYYRGILFLTTNRVKAFDEAFLSRIHVALHFHELTKDARKQVWTAFLRKVGVEAADFGEDLLDRLADEGVVDLVVEVSEDRYRFNPSALQNY